MGKSKKGRQRHRKGPDGAAVAPTVATDPSAASRQTVEEKDMADPTEVLISNIKEQLQQASAETKECGLQSLALTVDAKSSGQVIGSRLVRVAAPLMAEMAHPNVRHAALGALRNLSLVSPDVCDEMVKQDVMTPLCALLATYAGADWAVGVAEAAAPSDMQVDDGGGGEAAKGKRGKKKGKKSPQPHEVIDSTTEIFREAVGLLWNLCEANPAALEVSNREGVAEGLLRNLARREPALPAEVRLCLLQCLYTLTEGNPAAAQAVRRHAGLFEALLAAEDVGYEQVLALGVVTNTEGFQEKLWPRAFQVMAAALSVDHRQLANRYTSVCAIVANGGEKNGSGGEDGMAVEEEAAGEAADHDALREELNASLHAQQTALELLTNACCCGDDEEDEWVEDDEEGSDDCASMGSAPHSDEGRQMLSLPPLMVQLLQNHELVRLVSSKVELPAENTLEILRRGSREQGRMLLRMLQTLRSRALLCLSNLVPPLSADDLGGADGLFQMWARLGRLCFSDGGGGGGEGGEDPALAEAATSALRALTQKLSESKCHEQVRRSLEADDLKRMTAFGAASADPGVRANMVQVVGGVGAMLIDEKSANSAPSPAATAAANFLLEAASRDAHLRVVAEALDQLFDLFAEDWTDGLARAVSLLPRLRGLQPGLKAKMGMQRGAVGEEHYAVAVMARTNLARFIKYKQKALGASNGH